MIIFQNRQNFIQQHKFFLLKLPQIHRKGGGTMKKWFVRLGLVSILTLTIVSPASAAGEVKPQECTKWYCHIPW